jgi:hypothetical protein
MQLSGCIFFSLAFFHLARSKSPKGLLHRADSLQKPPYQQQHAEQAFGRESASWLRTSR